VFDPTRLREVLRELFIGTPNELAVVIHRYCPNAGGSSVD
jgi:hypothetical protein